VIIQVWLLLVQYSAHLDSTRIQEEEIQIPTCMPTYLHLCTYLPVALLLFMVQYSLLKIKKHYVWVPYKKGDI